MFILILLDKQSLQTYEENYVTKKKKRGYINTFTSPPSKKLKKIKKFKKKKRKEKKRKG